MKIDPYRGTGRTHRMLEQAIAHRGDDVVVVARTFDCAFRLCARASEMLGEDVAQRTRDTITRRDGRKMRFVSAGYARGPRMRGLEGHTYWDHDAVGS